MQGCSTVSHVEVAAVSDALKQIAGKKVYITHRMRPIYPMRFASYALTVSSKREANDDPDALKAMLQAIDDGTPNSVYVMVVENGNHKCRDGRINGHCHGSQTLFRRSDRRRGRDTAYLQKIGFPVYARGVVPSHIHRPLPVCRRECSRDLRRRACEPGGIIVADADGVVVVPKAVAPQVLKLAQDMDFKEHSIYAHIEKLESIEYAGAKFSRL